MDILQDNNHAIDLDRKDPLFRFRDEFVFEDPDLIYLNGNSLGRLPKSSRDRLDKAITEEWGSRLVRGWHEGWYEAPARIGAKMAKLIGAQEDEVVLSDSTSVNLFKLVMAALQARAGRNKVITDDLNFPSDVYVLQGAIKLSGGERFLQIVPSPDGINGPSEALAAEIDDDTALVSLTQASFKSSYLYDMAAITEIAHNRGAWVLWDVSHSVGAVPIDFNDLGVELAVGCTYKYLNGGPGSPAFLYVRRDLQERLLNPIQGWFGTSEPFEFGLDYEPAHGLRRFLTGTPPIISLSAVEPALDLLLEAGVDRVRAKSVQQTGYLIDLWGEHLRPLGFKLNSPKDSERRGSQVSLGHDDGYRICRALIEEKKVLPDFRAPDNIRLGIASLYTSFAELYEAVHRIRTVVEDSLFEKYPRKDPRET